MSNYKKKIILKARFKNQCMVVTDRDVKDFIKPNITELILSLISHRACCYTYLKPTHALFLKHTHIHI